MVRANAAVDSGRTLQQAVGDAQSTSQQALGGFVTRPLSVDEVSPGVSHETVAVLNERGVCYAFTLTVGPTHVTGSSVTVMDACPPSSS